MALSYDDDNAPAVEPGAPAKRGRLSYDAPAAAAAPPAAPEMSLPERQGRAITDAIRHSAVYGAADVAGSGLMKTGGMIGSGVAGLGAMLAHAFGLTEANPADVVNAGREATNVQPTSPGAATIQQGTGVVAKPFQAVAAPIDRAVSNLPAGPRTAIEATEEAIPAVASVLPLGQAARAAKAADVGAVVEGAAKPSVKAPLETARGAGYEAPPSVVEASNSADTVPGTTRESILGPSGIRKASNAKNQTVTTRLMGEEIGLKDAKKITAADADNFRKTGPGPKYDTVSEKLGTMPADEGTVAELNRLASIEDPKSALPNKAATNVERIANKITSGKYTGQDWRTDIGWLRENGARSAADALEDMADRQLAGTGDNVTLQTYRDARKDFAKSYDVQNAIGRGGQIDAHHFKDLDDKYSGKLTGNAKIVATAARELPEVTRIPGSDSGGGVHSRWQAAHNVVGSAIKKIPGMNPMTEGFQNRNFGREQTPVEKSYNPAFGARPGPLSEALELTAPAGRAGAPPQQLGMALTPGRAAPPAFDLAAPAGEVYTPAQRGSQLPQGPGPREQLSLTAPAGEVGVRPTQTQAPLLPPQKRLEDVLTPAAARRLGRILARREGVADETYIPALGESLGNKSED